MEGTNAYNTKLPPTDLRTTKRENHVTFSGDEFPVDSSEVMEDEAKKKTEDFLTSEKLFSFLHESEEVGSFRSFISAVPAQFMIPAGIGIMFGGAVLVAASAVGIGLTMGGATPVGFITGGVGLTLFTGGLGITALGITKAVRKASLNRSIRKYKKSIDLHPQQQNIKILLANVKANYPDYTLTESKMRLLEIQIKYDESLSHEQKMDLLMPYANEKIKKKDVAELRKRYEDLIASPKKE